MSERRIPIRRRDKRDVLLEEKVKELAVLSGMQEWLIRNVLRWRRAKGLPVFELGVHPGTGANY